MTYFIFSEQFLARLLFQIFQTRKKKIEKIYFILRASLLNCVLSLS